MRVLIINTNPVQKDGITSVIFNLIRTIDKTDATYDLLVPRAEIDSLIEEFRSYGGEVYFLPRSMKKVVQYVNSLKKIIKENKYDIVHIHGNSHTVVLELLAARLAGCKVRIVHAHNTMCNDLKLHKALTGIFNKLCTKRLACGVEAGKFMHGNNNFTVINNGIDVERFSYDEASRERVRQRYNFSENTVIGHIGIFNKAKNQDFLVDVMSELLKEDKSYKLILIGDGERRQEVEQKVKDTGLCDSIIFAGLTDDVPGYLSACDLFVLPSFYEGLPLVLVEAQANGLYCIVSDCVTTEADKTGNMSFLPLEAGAKTWAGEILKNKNCSDRKDVCEMAAENIKQKGYSATDEAKKLAEIYKNSIKGE